MQMTDSQGPTAVAEKLKVRKISVQMFENKWPRM